MEHQKENETDFLIRITGWLLFIRSGTASEISKLTAGRRSDIAFKKWRYAHTEALGGMIDRDQLRKTYDLPETFHFDVPCAEFVIDRQFYDSFKLLLADALVAKPALTLEEILRLPWKPKAAQKVRRKAGRPKAAVDPATGKAVNVSSFGAEVINCWNVKGNLEAVRLTLYPKTKMATTKQTEREKIRRFLYRNKDLLTIPYNTK